MKNKTAIFLLSLIVAAGFVCFPLFQASAKDTITVGFPMSLTGKYAPGAAGQMEAYQLWEETVNERGGIDVKKYGKKPEE